MRLGPGNLPIQSRARHPLSEVSPTPPSPKNILAEVCTFFFFFELVRDTADCDRCKHLYEVLIIPSAYISKFFGPISPTPIRYEEQTSMSLF